MYPKLFVTFSYYDGYRVCFANRIYSIHTPVTIRISRIENAKREFSKEMRFDSKKCEDIAITFWQIIYSDNDAVDDTANWKFI
jgi:hypothetical protein